MSRIVVNASPWIALSICGQTDILGKLYNEVYMPFAVKREILAGREKVGVKLKQKSELEVGSYPFTCEDLTLLL